MVCMCIGLFTRIGLVSQLSFHNFDATTAISQGSYKTVIFLERASISVVYSSMGKPYDWSLNQTKVRDNDIEQVLDAW